MNVAIIGGGAAGFFSAIAVKENYANAKVVIFEKAQKTLSKVKVSGGGRCNVTNGCTEINELITAYPRGGKRLKKAFHIFSTSDSMQWFESRGVPLIIQDDNCVFPVSQDSQSIIDCFLKEAKRLKIKLELKTGIKRIQPTDSQIELIFENENKKPQVYDKVIVTTGGSPKRAGLEWLEKLGHQIVNPVPSLFTFNVPREKLTNLMGVVVEKALVSIQGTKLKADGPLLITHWGLSGPAILKLSSFGARTLSEMNYNFKVQVNWVNEVNSELVMKTLKDLAGEHSKKMVTNIRPYFISERLWLFLLEKGEVPKDRKWGELGKKAVNKMVNLLTNDEYTVKGKTTFRDEFVTCGGVSLQSIDMSTMESKHCKNLYLAGEVLDIDAITGGYNLQAAWSTGFVAGKLL